jgi:hypothetical protein
LNDIYAVRWVSLFWSNPFSFRRVSPSVTRKRHYSLALKFDESHLFDMLFSRILPATHSPPVNMGFQKSIDITNVNRWDETEDKPLPWYMNIASGAIAGVTEILVCYPLDVVKTRFQLQVAGSEGAYKSMGDAFSRMIRQEGFGSLYRGIVPPILVEAPKRSIKFTANEEYGKLYKNLGLGAQTMSILTGMSAGATEALVVVSPDLIKIRLQDKANVRRAEHNLRHRAARCSFL